MYIHTPYISAHISINDRNTVVLFFKHAFVLYMSFVLYVRGHIMVLRATFLLADVGRASRGGQVYRFMIEQRSDTLALFSLKGDMCKLHREHNAAEQVSDTHQCVVGSLNLKVSDLKESSVPYRSHEVIWSIETMIYLFILNLPAK